jgi:hypothetical protein
MDRIAPYMLYGRWRDRDRLQPLVHRWLSFGVKDYYSVGRMLLGFDDPAWWVRYLNRNPLDNRRSNLVAYKLHGQFPAVRSHGPVWATSFPTSPVRLRRYSRHSSSPLAFSG